MSQSAQSSPERAFDRITMIGDVSSDQHLPEPTGRDPTPAAKCDPFTTDPLEGDHGLHSAADSDHGGQPDPSPAEDTPPPAVLEGGKKPSLLDKVVGEAQRLVGKATRNPEKAATGEIRKAEGKAAAKGGAMYSA